MSSTTPGTRVQESSPITSRAVRTILVVVLAATLLLLGWAVRDARAKAGYQDAFETGGLAAVVEHAATRGDAVMQFPGAVHAPYGCYLADGEVYTGPHARPVPRRGRRAGHHRLGWLTGHRSISVILTADTPSGPRIISRSSPLRMRPSTQAPS